METSKLLAILDKNVNQEQLAKDLAVELVLPYIKAKIAGVDLIPGTELDALAIKAVLDYLEAQVK
jgi:hypothetical protein